jgi:hypothetical protein
MAAEAGGAPPASALAAAHVVALPAGGYAAAPGQAAFFDAAAGAVHLI